MRGGCPDSWKMWCPHVSRCPHHIVWPPKAKFGPDTQNLSLIYRESTRDSSEISKIRQIRPKLAVLAQFLPHRKTQEKSVAMAPDLSSTLKILRPAQKRPLGKFISRWTCIRSSGGTMSDSTMYCFIKSNRPRSRAYGRLSRSI